MASKVRAFAVSLALFAGVAVESRSADSKQSLRGIQLGQSCLTALKMVKQFASTRAMRIEKACEELEPGMGGAFIVAKSNRGTIESELVVRALGTAATVSSVSDETRWRPSAESIPGLSELELQLRDRFGAEPAVEVLGFGPSLQSTIGVEHRHYVWGKGQEQFRLFHEQSARGAPDRTLPGARGQYVTATITSWDRGMRFDYALRLQLALVDADAQEAFWGRRLKDRAARDSMATRDALRF